MGYSIRRAAKKARVSPIRLSQWERGIRKPNIETLVRLAVLYRVLIDELCFNMRLATIKESEQEIKKQEVIDHKIHKEKPT